MTVLECLCVFSERQRRVLLFIVCNVPVVREARTCLHNQGVIERVVRGTETRVLVVRKARTCPHNHGVNCFSLSIWWQNQQVD